MSKRQPQKTHLVVDLLFAAAAFVLTFSVTLVSQRMLQRIASDAALSYGDVKAAKAIKQMIEWNTTDG